MGFIRTHFLAELSAKLSLLKAKEVIPVDLEERRRETFEKDPWWGWTTTQKTALAGARWAGSDGRGGFGGGKQVLESLGMLG